MAVFKDNIHNKPRPVGANSATTEKPTTEQIAGYIIDLTVKNVQLEQENAQLKAQLAAKVEPLSNIENIHPIKGVNTDMHGNPISGNNNLVWNDKQTLTNALARIAELEAQLAAKNELISNTEQLPVYDAEWLDRCLIGLCVSPYRFAHDLSLVSLNGYVLDPKASADIILRAVAKEINGDWVLTDQYATINYSTKKAKYFPHTHSSLFMVNSAIKFKDVNTAEKAIEILNGIEPQILKNYFA